MATSPAHRRLPLTHGVSLAKALFFTVPFLISQTSCTPSSKRIEGNVGKDTLLVSLDSTFDLGFSASYQAFLTGCLASKVGGQTTPTDGEIKIRFRNSKLPEVTEPCILEVELTATSTLKSKPFTISNSGDGIFYGKATLDASSPSTPSIAGGELNTTLSFTVAETSTIPEGATLVQNSTLACVQTGKSATFTVIEASNFPNSFIARGSVPDTTQPILCKQVDLSLSIPESNTSQSKPVKGIGDVASPISTSGSANAMEGNATIVITTQESKKLNIEVEFSKCPEGEVFDLNKRACTAR